MSYHYPADLAAFVRSSWCHVCPDTAEGLPPEEALETIFSICYQASFLREESRPVTFRVVVLAPELLPESDGPPDGFHRIRFGQRLGESIPRRILRRLSPAMEFSHSLLGVEHCGGDRFEVWGIVHSGTGWVSNLYGGRRPFKPFPSALVLSVTGVGSISISNGSRVVGKLSGGLLSAPSPDVLSAEWMRQLFTRVRQEVAELMVEQGRSRPQMDPSIGRSITLGVLRRAIQMVRDRGHGGTLLIADPDQTAELEAPENPFLIIRYGFVNEEPRRRYRSLLSRTLRILSEHFEDREIVSLTDYVQCQYPPLREVDVAIEEWSYLLASMASVDGAVLITQRFELIGFGVEISGALPPIKTIRRAVDIEATELRDEDTERFGTRHRSAYRLCAQLPEMVAIVISQDGQIQLVKQLNGQLTCWDQLSVGAQDI